MRRVGVTTSARLVVPGERAPGREEWSMPVAEECVAANQRYAENFTKGTLPMPPARAVVVIHHTDCGMMTFSNEQVQEKLRQSLGPEAGRVADTLDFLPFSDLEE